jgi:DNA-binding CsgD family transcriptional regulator
LSNRRIAEQLALSVRTVENHLHRAFGKLAISHRDQLARAAVQPWPAA